MQRKSKPAPLTPKGAAPGAERRKKEERKRKARAKMKKDKKARRLRRIRKTKDTGLKTRHYKVGSMMWANGRKNLR
jgi:hypothetical protein